MPYRSALPTPTPGLHVQPDPADPSYVLVKAIGSAGQVYYDLRVQRSMWADMGPICETYYEDWDARQSEPRIRLVD